MSGGLDMRHFISLLDYSTKELTALLDRADYLAKAWRTNSMPQSLKDKKVGLWFYGNGFRNRVAFELGLRAMGADVTYVPGELGKEEPLEDIGHYLQNWFDLLIVRANSHKKLLYLTEELEIPLINARTDYSHPCEIMGDLQFVRILRKSLENLNVVFIGEVSNLCMSWFEAAARFPIKVTQIAPSGYEAGKELLSKLKENAIGSIHVSNELDSSIEKADVVYTDCWPRTNNQDASEMIRKQFLPYQITGELLSTLNEKVIFLPCPPVTRGQEVSFDAMNSKLCMNYRAKEYLLHSQNAIIEKLMES